MAWRVHAAVALLLAVAGCSGGAFDEHAGFDRVALFEAEPVEPGDWPSVAALEGRCSSVLVAERLLVHAAHCGVNFERATFGDDVRAPRVSTRIEACGTHPGAALGNGLDIGFCRLAESPGVAPVRVLDAALAHLTPGLPVMRVGFGPSSAHDGFGVKRSQPGVILDGGDEILVGGGSGSCSGDSGGPLFVDDAELDPSLPAAWRVAGILSAGQSPGCEPGIDHYSPIRTALAWLEAESGLSIDVAEPHTGDDGSAAAGSTATRDSNVGGGCSLAGPRSTNGALELALAVLLGALVRNGRSRRNLGRAFPRS